MSRTVRNGKRALNFVLPTTGRLQGASTTDFGDTRINLIELICVSLPSLVLDWVYPFIPSIRCTRLFHQSVVLVVLRNHLNIEYKVPILRTHLTLTCQTCPQLESGIYSVLVIARNQFRTPTSKPAR
jgi:hypothetical protein